MRVVFVHVLLLSSLSFAASAEDIKQTKLYARIKSTLDQVDVIDTHDHLRPFDQLSFRDQTDRGMEMTLHSVWASTYFPWVNRLAPWESGKGLDAWWQSAQHDFDNARATSFYRSLLPAFRDLYHVDFDTITPEQARELNDRIVANYRDDKWLMEIVTQKARIEMMFIDPFWARLQFVRAYPFAVPVLNVTMLVKGTHPARFANPLDSPYEFAKREGLKAETLDDYQKLIEMIFAKAVESDAVCLKSTLAYERTLDFRKVPKNRAAVGFGKSPSEITAEEQRDFEDYMFWWITELSAKYELPFQIHTGQARIQGSNPMLLVDLIDANPKTTFILFHGGFPWIGETGVIAMRYKNVYVDSCWLPTLGYSTARRAYQEWLDVMPSDRIMWGADMQLAEGIYAATEFTRQCLSEALAEKVERGELREEHALQIGRQILRENALKLFPKLRRMLVRNETPTSGSPPK